MRGPIDFIIVGFAGNKFDGSIMKALGDALDKGIIGLVAIKLVMKDASGNVGVIDAVNPDDEYIFEFSKKYNADSSLITQEDIDEVADLIEADTSVGLLVIEQLWAKPLKEALLNANGVLVAEGRIHPDAAAELNK